MSKVITGDESNAMRRWRRRQTGGGEETPDFFCSPAATDDEGRAVLDDGPSPHCRVCGTSWKVHPRVAFPHTPWLFGEEQPEEGWPVDWPPESVDKHGISTARPVHPRGPTTLYPHGTPPDEDSKWCSRCKAWQPRDQFGENKTREDGLQDWDRECVKIFWRERRAAKRMSNSGRA